MRSAWGFAALCLGVTGVLMVSLRQGQEILRRPEARSPDGGPSLRGALRPRLSDERERTATLSTLTAHVLREPGDPKGLSDLAAAYLERSEKETRTEDLVHALDAAQRARDLDPSLEEASFNLALALDRLFLRRSAASAWSAYLKLDGTSRWAEEARRRQTTLQQPSAPERWRQSLAALPLVRPEALGTVARNLVEASPQMAREFAVEEALGSWADRIVAGDREGAGQQVRIAAALGQALWKAHGDRTVSAIVATVEDVAATPSLNSELALARAHQAFREAMRAFRRLATGEAGPLFTAAEEGFHRARSPAELWAAAGRARVLAFDTRYDVAVTTFRSVLTVANREELVSLRGWCHWGLGWIASRRGAYAEATRELQAAESAYTTLGESENLAAIVSFLGENLASLGQVSDAWDFRLRALTALSEWPLSLRRHVALMDASYWALERDFPSASLALQQENLRAAQESQDPVRLAEAHWALSRALLRLGRYSQARSALYTAFAHARQTPEGSPRTKLLADLSLAQGEALLRIEPGAALDPLSQAVDFFQKLEIPLSHSKALLVRAKFFLNAGREAEAEEDLMRARDHLEGVSRKIGNADLQASYAESIQGVYDEMAWLQWVSHSSALGALHVIERARSLGQTVSDRLPQRPTLEYALLRDRLLIWFIVDGQVHAFERRVGQARVERLVERFLAEIQRREETDELKSLSSQLYELLIPEPAQALADGQALYLIPDKVLNKLPFAALFDRRRSKFLLQENILVNLLSLAQKGRGTEKPRILAGLHPSALLVANPSIDRSLHASLPTLPGAERELGAARSFFDPSLLLKEEEATRDAILESLDRFDIFVFAGHALNDASHPSLSNLVVAPSPGKADLGILSARDISGRSFKRLRLVVLSACTSVGPRSARFSGLVGLARPFLSAGVDSVVGTLWPTDDLRNGVLLLSLYRQAGRQSASLALRNAQLELVRDQAEAWRQMHLWANFIDLEGKT